MARKKIIKSRLCSDYMYNNLTVARFINYVMQKGKKIKAQKIVYSVFDIIKNKLQKDPIEIFDKAIENARPLLKTKAKRIGGATYQVPIEVPETKGKSFAMKWIIFGAKSKKGKSMIDKLFEEIINASKNTGYAVKKKLETHKMAEANKAFSHFKW